VPFHCQYREELLNIRAAGFCAAYRIKGRPLAFLHHQSHCSKLCIRHVNQKEESLHFDKVIDEMTVRAELDPH